MSSKVLLTGATGFVGKQVLKYLQESNNEITLVVRAGWQRKIVNNKQITNVIETENIFTEDFGWWKRTCKDIDIIIHVAWYAEPGKYLLSDMNMDCLQGTLNLARGAVDAGVRRFIGIGTCFEYDLTGGVLSINTPLKPVTLYASAKAATYLSLLSLFAQKNIEFVWCRLFYLYGEGENKNRLVSYIRYQLENNQIAELSSGNQIRDFMDVAAAGRIIVDLALNMSICGAINICSGIPVTVRQLAEKIADEYGKRELLLFGARPDNIIDPVCVVGVK